MNIFLCAGDDDGFGGRDGKRDGHEGKNSKLCRDSSTRAGIFDPYDFYVDASMSCLLTPSPLPFAGILELLS